MWDATLSKDRSVRYPMRPSVTKRDNNSNSLRNSDSQGYESGKGSTTHPYALEARFTNSDGPTNNNNREYGQHYMKQGSTYSFLQGKNEEGSRAVASPYRRVSSNTIHNPCQPFRSNGTPPKISVRTSSDATQLPKPLVWSRTPLNVEDVQSRRVSTDQYNSQDFQPSVECKCPEIYYGRGTRGTKSNSKNQSPLRNSKKKYVFSPRDSSDGSDRRDSHGLSSHTPNRRGYPTTHNNETHSRPDSSSPTGSGLTRRPTPRKSDNQPTSKLVYRVSDTHNGIYSKSSNTSVPVHQTNSTATLSSPQQAQLQSPAQSQAVSAPKRVSSEKSISNTRRPSNPSSHFVTDSAQSTVSSSASEQIEQHQGDRGSPAMEGTRGQHHVWSPSGSKAVELHPQSTAPSNKASEVSSHTPNQLLVARKFVMKPTSYSTDDTTVHSNEMKQVEQAQLEMSSLRTKHMHSHSPMRTLESTASSLHGSETQLHHAIPKLATPQYSFVSTRQLLSSFMHSWKSKYEENKNAYYDGGYLKVTRGSLVENRYVVIQKLGWGEFSTVWLAYDTRYYAYKRSPRESFVALKIAKCRKSVTENTTYEINLLRYLCARLTNCPMTKLLDSFMITGEYGNHLCMVMPLHGANLLSIIDQMKAAKRQRSAEEIRMIKEVIASTLVGLHELSTINVIHTDIKPENIIATSPDPKVIEIMQSFSIHNSKSPKRRVVGVQELTQSMTEGDPNHLVCLADFGLSASLDNVQSVEQCRNPTVQSLMARVVASKKQFPVVTPGVMWNRQGTLIQTREYRAPEVILGLDFNCQTDVWSVGCTAFELITGSFLMDPKKRSANERQMDVEHIAMMMQLIGAFPAEISAMRTRHNGFYEARERGQEVSLPDGAPFYIDRFIDARGKFIYAERYRHYERRRIDVELEAFLPTSEAKMAASFILTCLYCYDPKNRPTAAEMLQHPWLREVCASSSSKYSTE